MKEILKLRINQEKNKKDQIWKHKYVGYTIEANACPDHTHMLVEIPPRMEIDVLGVEIMISMQ